MLGAAQLVLTVLWSEVILSALIIVEIRTLSLPLQRTGKYPIRTKCHGGNKTRRCDGKHWKQRTVFHRAVVQNLNEEVTFESKFPSQGHSGHMPRG